MKLRVKNIDVMDSCDPERAVQAAWSLIKAGGLNVDYPGKEKAVDEIERAFSCWVVEDGYSEKEIASILIEARLTYANLGFEDDMAMFVVNVEWPQQGG